MIRIPSLSCLHSVLLAVSVGMAMSAGCSDSSSDSDDCQDGLDNDGDGLIDFNDPGCPLNDGLFETPDPIYPACQDGEDNDGDDLIDFPDDPGCETPTDDTEENQPLSQCRDGIDNDEDGRIDYPNDPGCFSPFANDELDDCPSGSMCAACSNLLDDDMDGTVDYPNDPGCDTAVDNDEFNADVTNCGSNVPITDLPLSVLMSGEAIVNGQSQLVSPTCGGLGQETAYRIELLQPSLLIATTVLPGTSVDTVLYLRSTCRDITTELACNDDALDLRSAFEVEVEAGTYFLIVDAHHPTSAGPFQVRVDAYRPPGEECDPDIPNSCAPGYECRPLDDNTSIPTCELPSCMDEHDNDFDGIIDFPDDPGCEAEMDRDEHDDCPDGPNCAQCANTIDDDGDGNIDYPADTGCEFAGDDVEVDCNEEADPIESVVAGTTSDTTAGYSHDFAESCAPDNTAPDRVYVLDVPTTLSSLTIDTEGSSFDTVLALRTPTCDAVDLACDDEGGTGSLSSIELTDVAPDSYLIIVDGWGAGSGSYDLNVHGVIPAGGSCDVATVASGLYSCELGHFCDGSRCIPAACSNGGDDDDDNHVDFPADPGCTDISDADESDDCPSGPNCPQCANGIDDDGDGFIDYPFDPGCSAASIDDEEDCAVESDTIEPIVAGTTFGDTGGLSNDLLPSCVPFSPAPERVHLLAVEVPLLSLTLDTDGSSFDTVLVLRQPTCASEDMACDDDGGSGTSSFIELFDVDPGFYFVAVDGNVSGAGAYQLNVHGVIPGGEACDRALVDSGLYSCEVGYTCQGGVCLGAACNNGMDDDADGKIDVAEDPGCVNISDDNESDDCPSGPNCPQCANGIDDDMDGDRDFPKDSGCVVPSDDNEQDCEEEADSVIVLNSTNVVDGQISGSTMSAADDFVPLCNNSNTSGELTHLLNVPGDLLSLTVNTNGSDFDTVLSIKTPRCVEDDLVCDDDGGQNNQSALALGPLSAGPYFIIVDGYDSSSGDYTLSVHGVIAGGSECNEADVTAGLYSCQEGYACMGGVCAGVACNNGTDDDDPEDTLSDYPNDPGCSEFDDNDETDDCPSGASCPECSNLIDDDSDGFIDYGDDMGCSSAGDDVEEDCDESTDVVEITMSTTTGSTVGAVHDFTPSCVTTSAAEEVVHVLNIPGMLATLHADTVGSNYDTVLYIKRNECTNNDLSCNDDTVGVLSEVNIANIGPGSIFIIVDGWSSNEGDYVLNVSGVIKSGAACDQTQIDAGILTCAAGTTCTSGVCM